MFFVISGFAISLPFARSYVLGKPRPSISNFYWRRFLKIVPSYWYVIVMLLAVGYYTYPNLEFAFWDVPLHATFLHNLLPGHDSAYTGVLWSLAIEVQFYVLFVFIAGLFMRSPWLYMATAMAIAALYRAFALTQPD